MNTTAFDTIIKKKTELDELIKTTGQDALGGLFKEFFAEHPSVKALRWEQYTPYFNDGDPCTFTVGEISFNYGTEVGGDYDDGFYGSWSLGYYRDKGKDYLPNVPDETIAACAELNQLFQGQEGVLMAVFGDHSQITVTADEIQVDSYDHD